MVQITEDTVEQAAIEWFEGLGYTYVAGPEIAPGEPDAERDSLVMLFCNASLEKPSTGLTQLSPVMHRKKPFERY